VAALVAIDGSDTQQAICRVDVATGQTASLMLKHTPAAREAWATAWRLRVGGRPMAVCLEPSRGPLLEALWNDDVGVLYPRHPTTLAKSREAFSPSRAQDDPREADSRLERLVQPRDRRKAWRPAHAKTRTRQSRVEDRRRLVTDRPRLSQRLTALLNA
jgi:hypothetical protein